MVYLENKKFIVTLTKSVKQILKMSRLKKLKTWNININEKLKNLLQSISLLGSEFMINMGNSNFSQRKLWANKTYINTEEHRKFIRISFPWVQMIKMGVAASVNLNHTRGRRGCLERKYRSRKPIKMLA